MLLFNFSSGREVFFLKLHIVQPNISLQPSQRDVSIGFPTSQPSPYDEEVFFGLLSSISLQMWHVFIFKKCLFLQSIISFQLSWWDVSIGCPTSQSSTYDEEVILFWPIFNISKNVAYFYLKLCFLGSQSSPRSPLGGMS